MKARKYFSSYKDYFWAWEEEGRVIVIPGGETIAYREYIRQVLDALAPNGWPPFGSLLLAIAATNQSSGMPIQRIEDILYRRYGGQHPDPAIKAPYNEAMHFLGVLSALPAKYLTGDMRIQVFQLIFSDAHRRLSAQDSSEILAEWPSATGTEDVEAFTMRILVEDFQCIGLIGRKFPDTWSLMQQLAAVPELPEEITLREGGEAATGDFVEMLIGNYKTFHVGALIKFIWSGMTIPIHHTLPSMQPLGGISDISNRGDFDKLLVSEFANDEWLFLSRVANREALYLHRENPPGADDWRRILLVDVSLKSWGNPKILSYAVALAVARHPRTDIPCELFAVGTTPYPVAVNTVEEVINAVQLSPGVLEPSEGLSSALKLFGGKKGVEIFCIISDESLRHPAVQKVLADYYSGLRYIVVTDRGGGIDIYRNQHGGRKLVQQIRLPLEKLWRPRAQAASKDPAPMPAGLEHTGLIREILYPAVYAKVILAAWAGESFIITREKKLFRYTWPANKPSYSAQLKGNGWEMLLDDLDPGASIYAIGGTAADPLLLSFSKGSCQVTIHEIKSGLKASASFVWPARGHNRFVFSGPFFYGGEMSPFSRIAWENQQVIFANDVDISRAVLDEKVTANQELVAQSISMSRALKVLKNVDRVGINRSGNLLVNKHELVYNRYGKNGMVKLQPADTVARELELPAHRTRENQFVFPDGSEVLVDRSGMLILKAALTGEPMYDVKLKDAGGKKLNVVKLLVTLKKSEGQGLTEVQWLVGHLPVIVKDRLSLEAASSLKRALDEAGAESEVLVSVPNVYIPSALDVPLGLATKAVFAGREYFWPTQMPQVDTTHFYDRYIRSFIYNILKDGAKR